MGICLSISSSIIEINYKEKGNNEKDIHQYDINNINNKSTSNYFPQFKRNTSSYDIYVKSSGNLNWKNRPILNKLKNKNKSTSTGSLILYEK